MSGAESLAIFGIVCSVMQVISFVQDGTHMAKAIYETGSLDPNLTQTTEYIKGGLERLRDSLNKGKPLPLQRPFWISGKAGSGKSVLMKFLVDSPRTQSFLDHANATTIVLSHFIWATGQLLERNMQGILCSLIHQLLAAKPGLCRLVLKKFPASGQKRFPGDWSTNELRVLFVDVIPACGQHVCIFLDGVDEMDDYMTLVDLLDQLCGLPRLQVCMSSRPEPALQRCFHSYPQLRVQDLTRPDIKKYARDTLRKLHIDDVHIITRLVSTICSKADGVFLWVALALKNIQTGYENHDEWPELELRLESLPNDLNTLYQQMWRRLNDSETIYRETAAQYFNIMLECVGSPVLTRAASPLLLALALNPPLAVAVVTEDMESWEEEIEREYERISARLPIRCAGLLEVTADETVRFIHRSAHEFLMNTPEGERIRRADPSPHEIRRLNLIKGFLGCCKLKIETKKWTFPPRLLSLCGSLSLKFMDATGFFELCRYNLSSESINKLFKLARVLYSTGEWRFDNSFYLQPDFLGAVTCAGFFAQARAGFAQLTGAAPRGMRISRMYQAYMLQCALDAVRLGRVMAAQDLVFFSALDNTPSTQNARHNTIINYRIVFDILTMKAPPFYLTNDPLDILMGRFLKYGPHNNNLLHLMVSLLEEGYNLSNRGVILLEAFAPRLSRIFGPEEIRYPQFLPKGMMFIETNTSFRLNLFVRLLSRQQSAFPIINDSPTLFERLNTAVGCLATPEFSRLLAFVPQHTVPDGVHPEARPAEEDARDVHGGLGDSEDEKSDDEDIGSEEDSSIDLYTMSDLERRAWASSTEVRMLCTDDDSHAVLASLSDDIVTSIENGGRFVGLEIPYLQSRLEQILPNTRRATVQELEETLVQDGFLVPWSLGPDFWPPRVYSPDPQYDE